MTQINLLPWREQARHYKKLRFLAVLGMFVGLAVLLAIVLHLFIANLIRHQQYINDYLQSQFTKEESAVLMLNKKKKEGIAVYAKLKFIYSLQKQSYQAVRLLDTLTHIIPDGVLLTKLIREGSKVTLMGKAKSNLQVTVLMENISKTGIFNQPVLTEITGKENVTGDEKLFQITVVQQD